MEEVFTGKILFDIDFVSVEDPHYVLRPQEVPFPYHIVLDPYQEDLTEAGKLSNMLSSLRPFLEDHLQFRYVFLTSKTAYVITAVRINKLTFAAASGAEGHREPDVSDLCLADNTWIGVVFGKGVR